MTNAPSKIVILGANGQIATEVALYLCRRNDVQLHGLVRSRYGTILLDAAGVPCTVLDYGDISDENKSRLADADAVIDCTYPAGQQQNLIELIKSNAAAVMQCMTAGAIYVHSSSISAFGMPIESTHLRNYKIARTSYARTKRTAEKSISRLASRHRVRACHLRLGQVHGVLQSVTRQFRGLIDQGEIHSTGTPDSISTTVFCHSVAEAFLCAARGTFADASVTTVVSQPQWSLAMLFDVYREITGADFQVRYSNTANGSSGGRNLVSRLIQLGTPFRNVIESQVLPYFPGLVPKLKGQYRMQAARRERTQASGPSLQTPVFHLVGNTPGRVATEIKSSPEDTVHAFRAIQQLLDESLQATTT